MRIFGLVLKRLFLLTFGLLLGNERVSAEPQAPKTHLPSPLVYLREIDPTIAQDMKYATEDNFTGRRVPGYQAGECILVRAAAEALAEVQRDLRGLNLGLKVYDCLRPERATSAFVAWSQTREQNPSSGRFYPRLRKDRLFAEGYIARASSHSRGIAVDLTIIQLPVPPLPAAFDTAARYGPCNGPVRSRAPDNAVDMGTAFDCFDQMSSTHTPEISEEQRRWRERLITAMARHGFQNYRREWWHFTFQMKHPPASFDFPIGPVDTTTQPVSRPRANPQGAPP